MSDASYNAFAFRNAVVDGGTWAAMTGPERKLLYCYERHADGGGIAWPGDELLARETGVRIRNVQRARAALVARGLLGRVSAGGGRGRVTKWRLQTPAQCAPLSDGNTGAVRPKTPAQDGTKHRRRTPGNTGALRRSNSTGTNKEHHNNSAAGAGGGGGGVLGGADERCNFLMGIGVNIHTQIREGLRVHAWTVPELRETWRAVTNQHRQGERQGAMVALVTSGERRSGKRCER